MEWFEYYEYYGFHMKLVWDLISRFYEKPIDYIQKRIASKS